MARVAAPSNITSCDLAPTGEGALMIRLTPAMKQQLLDAARTGKVCSLRTVDSDGSGACLTIGSQVFALNAKPAGDMEVVRTTGGSSAQSTSISHRMTVAPAGTLAGPRPVPAAARAPSHPPMPSSFSADQKARTTAPQRSLLSVRKAPPQQRAAAPSVGPAPSKAPREPVGAPAATAEQMQHALLSGGLRMLLASALCARPLSRDALRKKVEAVCGQAKAPQPSKEEIQRELKHVAEYQSPGVYHLMDFAREEFERLRRSMGTRAGPRGEHQDENGGVSGRRPGGAVSRAQPSGTQRRRHRRSPPAADAEPVDREWTRELLSGSVGRRAAPGGGGGSGGEAWQEAPRGKSEGRSWRAVPDSGRPMKRLKRKASVEPADPADGPVAGQNSASFESNSTWLNAGSSPEKASHQNSSAMNLEIIKPARRQSSCADGARAGAMPGAPADPAKDTSWFAEHVNRPPTILRSISTRQEFDRVSREFNAKYAVYERLHREIREARRMASSMAQGRLDVDPRRSAAAASDLSLMWDIQSKRLPQMVSAYRCLHQELASLKAAAQKYAAAPL